MKDVIYNLQLPKTGRYIIFAYENFYPFGGLKDCVARTDNLEYAKFLCDALISLELLVLDTTDNDEDLLEQQFDNAFIYDSHAEIMPITFKEFSLSYNDTSRTPDYIYEGVKQSSEELKVRAKHFGNIYIDSPPTWDLEDDMKSALESFAFEAKVIEILMDEATK